MKLIKSHCLAITLLLTLASSPLLAQNPEGYPPGNSEHARPMKPRPMGIGHFARQNIAADALVNLSGQPRDQIVMQLQLAPPHRVAENLGVSEEAFRSAMQAGHQQLLERSVAAGIISQAQADQIAEAHKQRHARMARGQHLSSPPNLRQR